MYITKYYTFELYPWGGGGAAKQWLVDEEGMLDLSFLHIVMDFTACSCMCMVC